MLRLAALPALLAVAGVTAACGGDRTASAAPTISSSKQASVPGAATARRVAVTIKDFDFSPRRVTVARGGRVTWTDRDSANHTVTFKAQGVRSIDNLGQGERASVTFRRRGTFRYVCTYHPNMHGVVVVR